LELNVNRNPTGIKNIENLPMKSLGAGQEKQMN
jgi:hypothetical protein